MRCALVLFPKKDAEGFHIHFGLVEWVVGRGDVDVVLYEDCMGTLCDCCCTITVFFQGGRAEVDEWTADEKLEYIEPDRVAKAIICLQKLRTLSKKVQPNPVIRDGRAHEVFLEAAKRASGDAKRARTAPPAERGRTDGVL